MATQQAVIEFLNSNYNVEMLDGGLIKVVFKFEDGRTQMVLVGFTESKPAPALMITSSVFATTDDVSLKKALRASADGPLWVKLIGDLLAVTHAMPIADLDPSEIETGFSMVAVTADLLEQQLLGTDNF
jgi:hypothetical protein